MISDSEKWKKTIIQTLRIIYEVNITYEIESKLKMILNWSDKINQNNEENKQISDFSVPNDVYGKKIWIVQNSYSFFEKDEGIAK